MNLLHFCAKEVRFIKYAKYQQILKAETKDEVRMAKYCALVSIGVTLQEASQQSSMPRLTT